MPDYFAIVAEMKSRHQVRVRRWRRNTGERCCEYGNGDFANLHCPYPATANLKPKISARMMTAGLASVIFPAISLHST